jgi:hypothetical protein
VLENLLFARPNQTDESVWKAFAFGLPRSQRRAAADRAQHPERVRAVALADQPAPDSADRRSS